MPGGHTRAGNVSMVSKPHRARPPRRFFAIVHSVIGRRVMAVDGKPRAACQQLRRGAARVADALVRAGVHLSRIAQLDQRTALPDQCLHSAEADVRLPRRKSGFDPLRTSTGSSGLTRQRAFGAPKSAGYFARKRKLARSVPTMIFPVNPPSCDCLSVVRFRQGPPGTLNGYLLVRAEWRDQMGEHQMLRARALCHGAEVGARALAKIGIRKHSAAFVRPHDGMNRRMHDDVGALRQLLDLVGR